MNENRMDEKPTDELGRRLEHGRIRVVYHVVTSGRDEWFDEGQYENARMLYWRWALQFRCARLYVEHQLYDGDEWVEDLDEDCLEAIGPFPA